MLRQSEIPWSYSSYEEPFDEDSRYVCADRFYCFNWDLFTKEHWSRLDEVFRLLPGWIGYRGDSPKNYLNIAYWFGSDEEKLPFLSAWVEQPYLQVDGVVLPEDLRVWETTLLHLAVGLPKRVLTGWPGGKPAP